MKISKNKISGAHIAFLTVSVITIFVCAFKAEALYARIFVLPLTYFLCSLTLSVQRKRSLTVCIFDFCAFLRYVILPFFESLYPVYGFSAYKCYNQELITKSIFLMSYELVFLTMFILFILTVLRAKYNKPKKIVPSTSSLRFDSSSNDFRAVWIFVALSAALVVIRPSTLQQISFIAIKSDTGIRLGAEASQASTVDMIARQIFIVGFLSLFVVLAYKLRNANIGDRKALNVSLLLAVLCTCVIISEQRSSQVYCAFATIVLLIQLYPEKKRKIIRIISAAGVLIIALLSVYKTFYAFRYGSYAGAVAAAGFSFKSLTQTLETYLLGPQSVASALDFQNAYPQYSSIKQLIFDILRSTIGVNFFVKNSGTRLTSAQYNLFVTGGNSTSGYLLPISAQGSIVFGMVLSPLLMCVILRIAFYLENKMFNTKSAYLSFFMAYVYIRLATCLVSSNINTVLNALSSVLISAGIVYFIQHVLSKVCTVSKGREL